MGELCDYNASVANSLNRRQVSLAWTTIKILFKGFNFDFASEVVSMQQNNHPLKVTLGHQSGSGGGDAAAAAAAVAATAAGGRGGEAGGAGNVLEKEQLRLRHLSTKLRNLSGTGN